MNQLVDLPAVQAKLLARAEHRIQSYRRNSSHQIETALRSADTALRDLLRVWLWQHDAEHFDASAVELVGRCERLACGAMIVEMAQAVLDGCAKLRASPPRPPKDVLAEGGRQALEAMIERGEFVSRLFERLQEFVHASLQVRVGVRVGEWLKHRHWGLLQITAIKGLTLTFARAGGEPELADASPLIVRLPCEQLVHVDPAVEASRKVQDDQATFEFENESDSHHESGDIWAAFSDLEEGEDRLQRWLADSQEIMGHADLAAGPARPALVPWPPARLLASPAGVRHVAMVLMRQAHGWKLNGAWPTSTHCVQVAVELRRVLVFPDRCQAQLEVSWGLTLLTFFDETFVCERRLYVAGERYEFLLSGFAMSCSFAPDRTMKAKLPTQAALGRPEGPLGADDLEQQDVHTRGMAVLLPVRDMDRDMYQFHGTVRSVEAFTMLNTEAWRVVVVVLRAVEDDDEIALPVVVTARIWQNANPPRVGEDVEGVLRLQGRLWSGPAE